MSYFQVLEVQRTTEENVRDVLEEVGNNGFSNFQKTLNIFQDTSVKRKEKIILLKEVKIRFVC